jgi:hypothetical protein
MCGWAWSNYGIPHSWQLISGLRIEMRTSRIQSACRPTDFSAAILDFVSCVRAHTVPRRLHNAASFCDVIYFQKLCLISGGRGEHNCIRTFQKQHSGRHKRITQYVCARYLISLAITGLPQSCVIRLQYNSNFAIQNL